jgi:glycine cleavage system H protein
MQIDFCEFPEDALYDFENNVWVRLDGKKVIIGITSVHASFAGKLKEVKFKPVGSTLAKGQSVATIESIRYFGAVRTPVSGQLVEINSALEVKPKLANDSPYTEGWFVKIESRALEKALEKEVSQLRTVNDSQERIRSQIRELRVRCFKAYPDYEMWEIGVECAAALVRLNELMERCAIGEIVHLVSDDTTADIEMIRWSDQTGQEVLDTRQEEKLTHFIVKKVKE